eukprot:GHVU01210556.1.p1 GENE.GHVU01210556.1~~GHVU01210556.1.p1  ORF type:complete len:109 (+),score=0.56 GHVU01210556.1:361-687(+)
MQNFDRKSVQCTGCIAYLPLSKTRGSRGGNFCRMSGRFEIRLEIIFHRLHQGMVYLWYIDAKKAKWKSPQGRSQREGGSGMSHAAWSLSRLILLTPAEFPSEKKNTQK